MMQLSRHPKIIQLAADLGLSTSGDCLVRIREFALDQLASFAASFPIDNLDDLRRIVCNRLSLKVEWIESDADVDRIADEHAGFHPLLQQRLRMEFLEGTTEGITLQRSGLAPGQFEFLAVIDARGDRASRAYFTTWHEITHLLVEPIGENEALLFRRTPSPGQIQKDPVESLVDHVAGHLAFFPRYFEPVLHAAVGPRDVLTFEAVEKARNQVAPAASLLSAAIRSIHLVSVPMLLLCVEPGLTKKEERLLSSGQQTFAFAPPVVVPKLRVSQIISNDHVRSDTFEIRQNMRVPEQSVLAQAYENAFDVTLEAEEEQGWWETSRSGHLSPKRLWVQAARRGRYVYGLIMARATG